jgi:hypothetical protein
MGRTRSAMKVVRIVRRMGLVIEALLEMRLD